MSYPSKLQTDLRRSLEYRSSDGTLQGLSFHEQCQAIGEIERLQGIASTLFDGALKMKKALLFIRTDNLEQGMCFNGAIEKAIADVGPEMDVPIESKTTSPTPCDQCDGMGLVGVRINFKTYVDSIFNTRCPKCGLGHPKQAKHVCHICEKCKGEKVIMVPVGEYVHTHPGEGLDRPPKCSTCRDTGFLKADKPWEHGCKCDYHIETCVICFPPCPTCNKYYCGHPGCKAKSPHLH